MREMPPAISLRGLSKSFGSVLANDRVSLDIRRGEIHALLGENGSGKTTLMNMLSGIYQPDVGSISLDERPVVIRSPKEAIALGIGMIHQHFKLVDIFTARDNILIGRSRSRGVSPDALCARFGLRVDLDRKIYDLSVCEKQTVEILKVLTRGADKLILDEPTAVLTPQEIAILFDILRSMKREGHTVIIITHKLEEVLSVSDRVTVLHRGRNVGTVETGRADRYSLTEMMVGHAVDLHIRRAETLPGQPVLQVRDLCMTGRDGRKLLDGVSFGLREGEVLGVAGVAGSGQKALCEGIAGLQKVAGGSISLDGKRIDGLSPREIIRRGVSMAYIPEDRLGMGLVGGMSIPDNLLLKKYRDRKGILLRRKSARSEAAEMVKRLAIATPNLKIPVRKLSGGNVQKVLLGREIGLSPRVLITAYPVRGLDIGVSMTVYDMLNEQKKKGVGILYIGEDLDVLLALCDRIMVLCSGQVTAVVQARTATKSFLGLKMAGIRAEREDEDG